MRNYELVCAKHDTTLVFDKKHEYGDQYRCPTPRCHVKVVVWELAEEVIEFDPDDNCEGNCETCDDLECKQMQLEAEQQGMSDDELEIEGDDNGYNIYLN